MLREMQFQHVSKWVFDRIYKFTNDENLPYWKEYVHCTWECGVLTIKFKKYVEDLNVYYTVLDCILTFIKEDVKLGGKL